MSKIAFVFPGQGSQFVGMASDLATQYAEAKWVLQEVDDALGQPLSKLMKEGPIEELTLTENAQPALMAASLAVVRALESQMGKNISQMGHYVAGHSLGEYSALTAIGVLKVSDTAKLLKLRGQAMQRAVPAGQGAMAALIGLEANQVEQLVEKSAQGDVLASANDNGAGQIVISGAVAAVERAMIMAKEMGAKRALPLPVSAPFHCPLMQPAADEMKIALERTDFYPASLPIVTNVTADIETNPVILRKLLVDQVCGRVRWRESMMKMAELEVTQIVELGAGKVLSGLASRINPQLQGMAAGDPASLDALMAKLS